MKIFGILFSPIIACMIGLHVWARAESIPKTLDHKTPAFIMSGSMIENWKENKYTISITAKKPIWVLIAGYRDKDQIVRLNPKQTIKLSNISTTDSIRINQPNCTVRILSEDEVFEYKAC